MAIYHCSLRTFSRAQGHSAVAAAAYRSGARLKDERTGAVHRYEKRKGVRSAFILAPHGVPEKFLTRAFLWNAAESSETRKNSRVAREVILALPHELSDKARAELARDMGLYLMERYRVAVDVAIHSPVTGDGHDPRNHHAHLLFTTRELTNEGFGAKTRILDDKTTGPQEIKIIREVWETLANDALVRVGFSDVKIDRRTLEGQGIDRIPQTHEGKASKNAAAYESLLAKDFKKADRDDDEDESGEEGEGKKGSAGGTSGKGEKDGGAKLSSKAREDSKGRKIDYPALDQKQTRTTFNAEIKALNEKRAAFGDKPLKEQIAQLDRLMERLDKRVEKLQALETKTSLKEIIKQSIASVVKLATDLLTNRKEDGTVLKLTAEEKQARMERQITRYGRSYREGLRSQIKEMKQNMALVEAKKEDFRRYKSFVDSIDRELKKHSPSITTPSKEQNPPRQITNTEINLKLHLKAEMIRSNIPVEFRAPSPMKGERQTLTNSTAVNKILKTKIEPIRIDRTALSKPETPALTQQVTAKPSAPPVRAEFINKVQVQPTPKAQAEYKQPMPVRVRALEQAIAERQAARTETPRPEDRRIWFIPASEKTRPLQRSIEAAIRQQRREAPQARSTTETQNRFFRAQERPQKTATYSEVREKVRTEAETKRSGVPPEYRAEPYDRPREEPRQARSAEEKPRESASSTFSRATEAPNEPKSAKPRMSNTFNMKSGAQDAGQDQSPPSLDDKPEAEI